MGFGMTKDTVCTIVMDYLETNNRQHNFKGSPGWDWWNAFKKTMTKLVKKQPQLLPKQQSIGTNKKAVETWFAMVKERLEKLNIADQSDFRYKIKNCDETVNLHGFTIKKLWHKRFKVGT